MEVKVFCPCGSKYKFDVEPVNERMPWPVNCPACGADGTALANEIIALTLAANPPPAPPPPVASAPAPAPAAGGLRINKPAPAPPPVAGMPPPAGAPPRFTPATPRPLVAAQPPSHEPAWKKIGGGIFGVIVIGLIAFRWIWRIYRISHAITHAGNVTVPDSQQIIAAMQEAKEMNLVVGDNNVVLYVKHDDYREVAQDCLAFWKEQDHRNFQILPAERSTGNASEFLVYPAHNGYVCVLSDLSWKDPVFESTAQHLSQKYNTLVFGQKDVEEPGEFVFGVYDQGSSVFLARMTENKNGDEQAKVEHVEWAKAHGYKPGSHGTKDFDMLDANILTKNCGMKFWDQPIMLASNYLVLAAANK